MLGCVVQSDPAGEEITVDKNELEDARWFTRDQVASMVANVQEGRPAPNAGDDPSTYWVPPGTSIAGQMLKAFAGGDPITCFTSPRL
jgi:NAD+ diphosphatase